MKAAAWIGAAVAIGVAGAWLVREGAARSLERYSERVMTERTGWYR